MQPVYYLPSASSNGYPNTLIHLAELVFEAIDYSLAFGKSH
jgi:hypothetical protein